MHKLVCQPKKKGLFEVKYQRPKPRSHPQITLKYTASSPQSIAVSMADQRQPSGMFAWILNHLNDLYSVCLPTAQCDSDPVYRECTAQRNAFNVCLHPFPSTAQLLSIKHLCCPLNITALACVLTHTPFKH